MITAIIIFAVVLWLGFGLFLTVFVFSQFPFVDAGPHFIVLWPIVLHTSFGVIGLLGVLSIYGALVWGSTYVFQWLP